MPRPILFLVMLVILLVAAMFFLSSRATEVPRGTIEVDVNAPANAA